jgi:hypothetical protein
MVDPLVIARDRLAKAEARLKRAEKAVESARSEVADLRIAVRVMAEITGESAEPTTQESSVSSRVSQIFSLLPVGEQNGVAPAQIYEKFKLMDGDDISADTFRTTIWRMKDKIYLFTGQMPAAVRSADGKYWRDPIARKEAPDAEAAEASKSMGPVGREGGYPPSTPEGSIPSGSTPVQTTSEWDEDLDDDVPF